MSCIHTKYMEIISSRNVSELLHTEQLLIKAVLMIRSVSLGTCQDLRFESAIPIQCKVHSLQEAQLPQRNSASAAHMEAAKPSSPLPIPLWLHLDAYGRIRNPQQTYAKRAVRKAHFKLNRAFKVIQGPFVPTGTQSGVLS